MNGCVHEWEWQMDDNLTSWIRCKKCGKNMFQKGIGVILINWEATDMSKVNLDEVLISNLLLRGIVKKLISKNP